MQWQQIKDKMVDWVFVYEACIAKGGVYVVNR